MLRVINFIKRKHSTTIRVQVILIKDKNLKSIFKQCETQCTINHIMAIIMEVSIHLPSNLVKSPARHHLLQFLLKPTQSRWQVVVYRAKMPTVFAHSCSCIHKRVNSGIQNMHTHTQASVNKNINLSWWRTIFPITNNINENEFFSISLTNAKGMRSKIIRSNRPI